MCESVDSEQAEPVSGRRKQRFLQFRLGFRQLPVVLRRYAGGQRVARASRVCTHCGSVAVADELHIIFECPALQAVKVFKFVLDCLDVFHT